MLDPDDPDDLDDTPGTAAGWLLPSSQAEYPGRPTLAEPVLHARRERTFTTVVVLAAAAGALLVLVSDPVIDVALVVSRIAPGRELATALLVPVGALTSALALFAVMLACELFGGRRARSLVTAGILVGAVFVGISYVTELVDPQARRVANAAALAACLVASELVTVVMFDRLRRWLGGRAVVVRALATAIVAAGAGWGAYAGIADALGVADDSLAALALGGGLTTLAGAIVLAPPLAIATRALPLYLRVARRPAFALRLDLADDDSYRAGPVERFG